MSQFSEKIILQQLIDLKNLSRNITLEKKIIYTTKNYSEKLKIKTLILLKLKKKTFKISMSTL